MKYDDADEFKKALDQHIKETNRSLQDQHDMKGRISTERIMSRIDSKDAFLQGGAATKYSVPNSPYTKDVDLIITDEKVKEMGWDKMPPDERAESMRVWLGQELAESKGDHFKFRTDQSYAIKDLGPGEPCARVIVGIEVGKQDFHLYEVDLAMQNKETPTRETTGHDLLSFAGVENPEIHTMCPEYIIADKVTLYLKENGKEDFERSNDLAHAALLIQNTDLDLDRLTEGLAQYAIQRDVVNELIEYMPDAPDRWEDKFQEAMEQSKSDLSLAEAMDMIRDTVDLVRDRAFDVALDRYEEMDRAAENLLQERGETSERIEPQELKSIEVSRDQEIDTREPTLTTDPRHQLDLAVIDQDLKRDLDQELNNLQDLSSVRDIPSEVGDYLKSVLEPDRFDMLNEPIPADRTDIERGMGWVESVTPGALEQISQYLQGKEQDQTPAAELEQSHDLDLANELYTAQDRPQEQGIDLESQQALELLTQLQEPPQIDRSVEVDRGTADGGTRSAGVEHAAIEHTGMERTPGIQHTGMEHGYGFDTTDSFDRGGDGDIDRGDGDMDRGSER